MILASDSCTLDNMTTTHSAGLWLNIPDYDAPTQLVKPAERNTRYVNAVMTIPKVPSLPWKEGQSNFELCHCSLCVIALLQNSTGLQTGYLGSKSRPSCH